MIKRRLFLVILLLATLIIFFGFTDPENIPVGLLIIPIIFIFIIFLLLSDVFIKLFKPNLGKTKQKNLSVLIAMVLALFLLFYSAGGIVLGDLILIVLIFSIGLLYINKY